MKRATEVSSNELSIVRFADVMILFSPRPQRLIAGLFSVVRYADCHMAASDSFTHKSHGSLLRVLGVGFGLAVTLDLHPPRVAREEAAELMVRAHQFCPYSIATRGNVEVTLAVDGVRIPTPVASGSAVAASSS